MGAVQDEIDQIAQTGSGLNDLLSELGNVTVPRKYEDISLIRQRRSLTMTLPADSWQAEDRTLSEPGTVDAVWLADAGWLLVNMTGDDDE